MQYRILSSLLALCIVLAGPLSSLGQNAEVWLTINRPASAEPYLTVYVVKRYGSTQIPFAGAELSVKGPEGFSQSVRADLLGRAKVNPASVIATLNAKPNLLKLEITARLDRSVATQSITVSKDEIDLYLAGAAEILTEEGNQLAKEGNLRESLKRYRKALDFDARSPRASYNYALAAEKLGMGHVALAGYSHYLLNGSAETGDRVAVKRRAVQLAKSLTTGSPLPRDALKFLDQASKAITARDYFRAVYFYELAESFAPWWPEPYYSEGLVFEYMAYQNDFVSYASTAVQNFELFLEAVSPNDKRVPDVQSRVGQLKKIEQGLNAPRTIPVR